MKVFTISIWIYKINVFKNNRDAFRQGLVQGEKLVVYPILEWLFQNITDLKKRAYLAKYLVKVEIPVEMLGDGDIAALYEQVIFILFYYNFHICKLKNKFHILILV